MIGGRYGLSSKEFTPAMVKSVYDNLKKQDPKDHFTVGINDDVTHTSLTYDASFSTEPDSVVRALFYGLGADGTVGANKNSIKIIGENTDNYAQGYFVYDSKKSGAMTVSHLRFGPQPIKSSYLVSKANFIACHQWIFLERYDMLSALVEGGTFLLSSPFSQDEVWDHLPREVQSQLIAKKAKFYVIDAYQVAKDTGMGSRMNTIMQVCFFAISKVLPRDEAIEAIRESIRHTYGRKGEDVVQKNMKAVDETLAHLHEIRVPEHVSSKTEIPAAFPGAPKFEHDILGAIYAGKGDELPVSAFSCDGTFPTGTAKWEKRNLALEIPAWDPKICIQCGKCAMVCPHAVIRIKVYDSKELSSAPATFKSCDARDKEWAGLKYTIQVAPEDCTGCGVCVDVCPVKNKAETRLKAINMVPQPPLRTPESENWDFFLKVCRNLIAARSKLEPFASNRCRSRYLNSPALAPAAAKLHTSSWSLSSSEIAPSSPMRPDARRSTAATCLPLRGQRTPMDGARHGRTLFSKTMPNSASASASPSTSKPNSRASCCCAWQRRSATTWPRHPGCQAKRRSRHLRAASARRRPERETAQARFSPRPRQLLSLADMLVKKSVWIVGGDGWAYDIGYGGLDHVLASGRNVNILVLDTEVYSNTGGQASKSTPRARLPSSPPEANPVPRKISA